MQIANVKSLNLSDYNYELPEERIAYHPLPQRDDAKLLCYTSGKISHENFKDLPALLPENSLLFFNDTRVIPARLIFSKSSGASIEVFLLEPIEPYTLYQLAITSSSPCVWKCSIGNLKRWKHGSALNQLLSDETTLCVHLKDREEGLVEFYWDNPEKNFLEVIEQMGKVPLPPYIKREAAADDEQRYQTVYSKHQGAVAAPTAGLHFTEDILHDLNKKNIALQHLTLHVSAGTFQPIKVENFLEHQMHHEQLIIKRENIEALLDTSKKIIAVGTTAMRTLESLYWWAVKLKSNPKAPFNIEKLFPYQDNSIRLNKAEAAEVILAYMNQQKIDAISGETSIFIFPGYKFRVCDGLITNFHQPGSTLILLVAAFVGEDWKLIYNEALRNNYRFLSYGDSNLYLP